MLLLGSHSLIWLCVHAAKELLMPMNPLPSQDMLDRLLTYVPETGKLYWKDRPTSMFTDGKQSAAHNASIWNGKNAGREAFKTRMATGHLSAGIFGKTLLAHRVIWKLVYDEEPDVIDHIDGNPANNLLSNLRSVGQRINSRNCQISKNNTSGFNGVQRDKRTGHWIARIMVNRKTIHLGCFADINDAVRVRREAEILHGFHPNHGRQRLAAVT